jgi:hypothetical protein
MMLMDDKTYHPATIIIFYYLLSLWAIISMSGCSGNIPKASKLESGEVTLKWNEF